MICSIEGNAEQLTVTLRAQPRLQNVYDLTWPPVLLIFVMFLRLPLIIPAGTALFVLFRFATILQRMFGKSILTANGASVKLTREVLGIRRNKHFSREDFESLSFRPAHSTYKGGDFSSCLGIIAKPLMTPCQFGITIRLEEAEEVFTAMKASGSWLAERIRPIGMQN
jgi:hypothetical protein